MKPSLLLSLLLVATAGGCALTVTRPVQEMSNTQAALRAAREVKADTLAPELYRQANEWYFKARQHYHLKNFKEARQAAVTARNFAEDAEFEAIRNGAQRTSLAPPDPLDSGGQSSGDATDYGDEYEQKNGAVFVESFNDAKKK